MKKINPAVSPGETDLLFYLLLNYQIKLFIDLIILFILKIINV